eukprot:g10847.t1
MSMSAMLWLVLLVKETKTGILGLETPPLCFLPATRLTGRKGTERSRNSKTRKKKITTTSRGPFGSVAWAKAISEAKPLLHLFGHIHEQVSMFRVGQMLVFLISFAVTFGAPIYCTTGLSSLLDVAECYNDHYYPASSLSTIPFPTAAEAADLRAAVRALLNNDGNCNSITLGGSISAHMSISLFTDSTHNLQYCMLMDTSDANNDNNYDKGFGLVAVANRRQDIHRYMVHGAPHPLSDSRTELQAMYLLGQTGGHVGVVSGFRRDASTATSTCQSSYGAMDAAHDTATAYFITMAEIYKWYQEQPSIPTYQWVEWHGKGSTTCPTLDAFVACGNLASADSATYSGAGAPCARAQALANAASTMNALSVHTPFSTPETTICSLRASDNILARLINGAEESQVCGTSLGSGNPASGKFIHIEQAIALRSTSRGPGPLAWVAPLKTAFPAQCPNGYAESSQTGMCVVAAPSSTSSPSESRSSLPSWTSSPSKSSLPSSTSSPSRSSSPAPSTSSTPVSSTTSTPSKTSTPAPSSTSSASTTSSTSTTATPTQSPSLPPASSPAPAINCVAGLTSLMDVADCVNNYYLPTGTYTDVRNPAEAEKADLRAAVRALLNNDGNCNSITLGSSISAHMKIVLFTDNTHNIEYCLLMDTSDADGNNDFDKGFGLVAVANRKQDIHRYMVHSAPHPVTDFKTEMEALYLMAQTGAHAAIVSGVVRDVSSVDSTCQPGYWSMDGAHNTDTAYFTLVSEVYKWYLEQPSIPAPIWLEWHGKGATSCPTLDAFLSCGNLPSADSVTYSVGAPCEKAQALANAASAMNSLAAHTPLSTPEVCGLRGSNNPLGRFMNGVAESQVCGTSLGSGNPASGKFVHIEQAIALRSFDNGPGPVVWVAPLKATFPAQCRPGYIESSETGMCVVAAPSSTSSPSESRSSLPSWTSSPSKSSLPSSTSSPSRSSSPAPSTSSTPVSSTTSTPSKTSTPAPSSTSSASTSSSTSTIATPTRSPSLPPASSPAPAINCVAGLTSLMDVADCVNNYYLPTGTYTDVRNPAEAEKADLRAAVRALLNNDGNCNSITLGSSISAHMKIVLFTDNTHNIEYCLLMDTSVADGNNDFDKGFGLVAVANRKQDIHRYMVHSAPHPVTDFKTEMEALYLMAQTGAHAAIVSGVVRDVSSVDSTCQPGYWSMDGAHNTDTAYFTLVSEVYKWYLEQPSIPAPIWLEWHGKGATSCPTLDAFLSCGNLPSADSVTYSVGAPCEKAQALANAASAMNSLAAHTPLSTPEVCGLRGSNNPLGRFMNGVAESQVCGTSLGSGNPASGKFVHIEQAIALRSFDNGPGPVVWVAPLKATFPAQCRPGYIESSETGMCVVAAASQTPSRSPDPSQSPTSS